MRRWLIGSMLVFACCKLHAQNTFFFSHYMFNPLYYNPGWAGVERQGFVAFQYRNQWTGYTSSFDGSGGAPNTQLVSAMVPVNGIIGGLGLNVSNDNLGPVSNLQAQLSIAFQRQVRSGVISLGLMPVLFSQTLKFDELRFNDPRDPLNNGTRETQMKPDLGVGIYYSSGKNFHIGISALNVLEPSFNFGINPDTVEFNNDLKRSFSIHGGSALKINEDLRILPSAIIRSDLNEFTFDVSAIAVYKSKMWGGLSYRLSESAVILLGYSLLPDNVLKIGYSFDYVVQEQDAKQATSHELFIRYDLPDLIFGGRKSVKTPRFSF